MKFAGMTAIMIACAAAGILRYHRSVERVAICRELVMLCDCIRRDFLCRATPIETLLCTIIENQGLKHLSFLTQHCISDDKAMQTTRLPDNMKGEIHNFMFSLGKSDLPTQLDLVASFREYMACEEEKWKKYHAKTAGLYPAFGIFSGVLIALVFV